MARKDAKGFPAGGYRVENAPSREAALRGMTRKWADFTITGKDLLKAPENELLQAAVLATFIDGQKVFERNDACTTFISPKQPNHEITHRSICFDSPGISKLQNEKGNEFVANEMMKVLVK